ncbi:MAG: hypothetical protein A4S09_11235 [Proteobacteria bacterium SG_bin7]|nr:MAG: hypothetical protein A4S09_11235 [Proteobacteria bacterium SG_bin7]
MFAKESRFLIIDDMSSIRDFVHASLKSLGYENILEAPDGVIAIEILKKQSRNGAPIDVILCDWNMPKLMGIDLLRQIREAPEWEFVPFIMITTESEKSQILQAISSGVTDYIVKPFSVSVLQQKLLAAYKRSLANPSR